MFTSSCTPFIPLISLIWMLISFFVYRLDLVSRLPELDQEESDIENLDFSSWLSTDSLDLLGTLDLEGQ